MHSMERKDIILWVILISLRNAYKLIEDLDLECKYYWYGATMYFKAVFQMLCFTKDGFKKTSCLNSPNDFQFWSILHINC